MLELVADRFVLEALEAFSHQFGLIVEGFGRVAELIGEQRDRPMPPIELMVRRPGFKSATGEFITRIKCRQVLRQNNLVVADILIDWQQSPVEVNDVVFY